MFSEKKKEEGKGEGHTACFNELGFAQQNGSLGKVGKVIERKGAGRVYDKSSWIFGQYFIAQNYLFWRICLSVEKM